MLGTLFDRRTRFARELLVALHARFGPDMYETVVRANVRLREAAACGRPVFDLAPRCSAADDFRALAAEVLAETPRLGRELQTPAPRRNRPAAFGLPLVEVGIGPRSGATKED